MTEIITSEAGNKVPVTDGQQGASNRRKVVRGAFAIFLVAFALAVTMTAIILFVSSRAEMMAYRNEETFRVAILAATIDRDILQVSSDLLILACGRTIKKLWDDTGNPLPDVLPHLAEEYLNISRHRRLYDQVRLLGNEDHLR